MKKIISAKNIHLSTAVKETVESRLENLSNHYPGIIKATCFMKADKHGSIVEVILSGKKFHKTAKASTENLYLSIHEAIDKAEAQLEKFYGKRMKKATHLGEIEAQIARSKSNKEAIDPAFELTVLELEDELIAS